MDPIACIYTCSLLFIGWMFILPLSIYAISEELFSLGIYHSPSLKGNILNLIHWDMSGTEPFSIKYRKVLPINFVFTVIFMIVYFVVIPDAVGHNTLDTFQLFCFSYVLTLVSILTIRLLSNQSAFLAPGVANISTVALKEDYVKKRNEKASGHFHTLICTSIMIIGIIVSANILDNQPISLGQFGNLDLRYYWIAFCIYIVALPIFTFIIEILLLIFKPLIQDEKFYITGSQKFTIQKGSGQSGSGQSGSGQPDSGQPDSGQRGSSG